MTSDRELMQQALDASHELLQVIGRSAGANPQKALDMATEVNEALRARLAQPEQEPVAWKYETPAYVSLQWKQRDDWRDGNWTALYTAPPQREWQGLTDEEIKACCVDGGSDDYEVARAIEAKLKEKNND